MRSSIEALLDGRYFHETCREEPFKSFLEDCRDYAHEPV